MLRNCYKKEQLRNIKKMRLKIRFKRKKNHNFTKKNKFNATIWLCFFEKKQKFLTSMLLMLDQTA